MYDILLNALKKIRDEEGRVCEEFEICKHTACRSSYAAWEIADRALETFATFNEGE
jgi:hypothetical protein